MTLKTNPVTFHIILYIQKTYNKGRYNCSCFNVIFTQIGQWISPCYSRDTSLFIACSFSKVPGPFSYDSQWGAAARRMESSHFGKACHFHWQRGALSEVVGRFNFTDANTQSGLLSVWADSSRGRSLGGFWPETAGTVGREKRGAAVCNSSEVITEMCWVLWLPLSYYLHNMRFIIRVLLRAIRK